MNNASLKPGLNINIIFTLDFETETVDVRTAIIYDIVGEDIILSQTNPPFVERHLGKEVSVTYLTKENNSAARYGFEGKVANVIREYKLNSSNTVPAIIIKKNTGLKKYNLRMSYRVKPKSNDISLSIYFADEKVQILVISIGGALFCRTSDHLTETGKIKRLDLFIEGQQFQIDCKILNAWFPSDTVRLPDLEYVKLQFLDMDKKCCRLLNEKLFAIQREILSRY
ncbi:MAG: hypothetical protein L7F78_13040 [Syntrophales bacterium LBB04]|nr:hypothetical protein [Syntrophales bacterium LBB04]